MRVLVLLLCGLLLAAWIGSPSNNLPVGFLVTGYLLFRAAPAVRADFRRLWNWRPSLRNNRDAVTG